jgi:PAS domain S-box-containing protein
MIAPESSLHPLRFILPKSTLRGKGIEGFIRSLLDHIAIGIVILGPEMEILWMNKNFRDAFPHIDPSTRPLCYKSFYSPPRDRICDYCPAKKAFETGRVHTAWTERCSNGRLYHLVASPIKNKDGRVVSVIETAIDITEQREAERVAAEVRHDWEETFDGITDMITIHDRDFNILLANRAAKEILKLPELGLNKVIKCFNYYHGKECPPEGCPSCECLKTGKPATFEMFEPHLGRYIEIRAMPRFDERGQLVGLIHIVRDITDRKKAEEDRAWLFNEIMNAKAQWEMTFDNASEIILLVDKDFRIIKCNRSFAELTGVPIKELVGQRCTDFLPFNPDELKTSDRIIRREVRTEKGIWLYLSFYTIRDESGDLLHHIIIGTDVTELKETQQKLHASERELKKRVDELERFYRITIDREARMRELKMQIRRLNEEIKRLKMVEA